VQHNKSLVLEAIKRLGHVVSAADVAAKTGLSLAESRISLNKIALDTKAVLEVSPAGDISYRFFPDLEAIYRMVGIKRIAFHIWKYVYTIGFFILRVSFGVLLIASFITIVIVFLVALVFILCGIGAAEAADGDLGDFNADLDFDFFDWDELGAFFAWSTLAGAKTQTTPEDYYGVALDGGDKGFFQNCFSFLFGDGNPNSHLDESQWHLIAECIRRNQGVVTAEQLAPYMINNHTDSRAMLSVMVRFEGTPEVTSTGHIVYSFPSLQVTSSGLQRLVELPKQIEEKEWKFTTVPTERLHWVFFFAGANLCGAYALNAHLAWFQPLIPYAEPIHWMLSYAIFFMCFPIVRELCNSVLNAIVETRNKIRARSAAALANAENQFKLAEARQFATQLLNLAAQPVFYTTGQNILEQDTDGLAQQFIQIEGAYALEAQAAEPGGTPALPAIPAQAATSIVSTQAAATHLPA